MASIARSSLLRQVATKPALQNSIIARAAFHTTAKRDLLPPLPQRVVGTVNDAAPVPPPSPSHGSYHWTFDRLVAASLIPITVAPFAAGSLNPTMDAVLCATLLIHSHTGFQNIIVDYVPQYRTPRARKAAIWGLNAATVVVGLALYEYETSDVGITETIKRLWKA
ncbi:putative mitochondrial succinate dehydrogenase cytochrome b small subunit precursor [Cercophora samala]|uniref:Succinate dehydrogenase [ubiquinone] cytochrome b small subunit n=2 Tax=Sordariales TaxID=5139 RepID=A0AA40DC51_9PEZI|nr:putative mitochondrial succinate dehydrogenase cytochrome b small subunit precursor [Cercophora samala]VBB71666.1 Putative mitochondrial succinate dehydrogenase [ubiquinone] cytochrome b small subunit precursor [Podospora comata]